MKSIVLIKFELVMGSVDIKVIQTVYLSSRFTYQDFYIPYFFYFYNNQIVVIFFILKSKLLYTYLYINSVRSENIKCWLFPLTLIHYV